MNSKKEALSLKKDLDAKNNKKICSIIYHGRNDNYNTHFLHRLNYVLEFEASNLHAIGLSDYIDLIVVDWGSDKKFSQELVLTSESAKLIKFFEVSKEIATKEGDPSKNYYHGTKVQNTGLRCVNTEYAIITSHDLIFGKVALMNLYNLLICKTIDFEQLQNSFFHIPKFHLPEDLFHETPSFKYLSRWLERSSFLEGDMGVKSGAAQASEMATQAIWNKLTGVNEKFSKYGFIDIDLHSRASMIAPCLDSFKYGICMYKLPRGQALVRSTEIKKNYNASFTSFIPNVNSENWGIKNYQIPFFSSKNIKKSIEEKNLVLITKNKKHNIFYNLFSIFLVPVSLRIFFISFLEVTLFKYIHLLVSQGNVRTLVSFGYRDAYGPLLIVKLKSSLEILILDNIKKAAKELHKSNSRKSLEESSIGILANRLVLVTNATIRNLSPLINHLGYFRAVNSLEKEQIKSIFNDIAQEKFSNVLFFRYSEIKHIDIKFIQDNIIEYSNKIFAIVFFDFGKNNKIFSNLKDFVSIKTPFNKINILLNSNYKSSTSNLYPDISKYRFIRLLILFLLTNTILTCSNIYRITKSLLRRIFYFIT